ncbi:hypothetical protein [uncultured Aquabacterium sp.]|uniref:HNH endonuclease n=1 Tax=Aquabacterium sp. TaxID=1872578 RepID=UPI0025E0C762|nr:hypothetical protein [uncultured Aquabacterium sp.]
MSHYLFRWGPEDWPPHLFDDSVARARSGESVRWMCKANLKRIGAGDAFFLLRCGAASPGIVGFGRVGSAPFQAPHFDPAEQAKGTVADFVQLRFDHICGSTQAPLVPRHELLQGDLVCGEWQSRSTGKLLPPQVAQALQKLVEQRSPAKDFVGADEIEPDQAPLKEGATKTVLVNAYERSAEARRRCIEHHGYACAVCDVHFELHYGSELGKGFIHVHHLKPLHVIGVDYEVDPVADLRPVCPNCHAMLHRKRGQTLSIEELRGIHQKYRMARGLD